MTTEDEKPKVELSKYRKHQRKIPWSLIRKIIIALVMIGLFYYLFNRLEEKKNEKNLPSTNDENGIPVEISD